MNTCITVTAHTPAGFATGCPWSPTLDGILSYAFMQEKLGPDIGTNLNLTAVEGLPLATESWDGEWWYVCGTPRTSPSLRQRDKHFHRRFNSVDAETFMTAKSVNTTMGPHKNLRKPHLVSTCASVSWDAVGDPDEVRRLLQSIRSIGSGWSRGLGQVSAWDVTTGAAMPVCRPVPAGFGTSAGITGPVMTHALRPPSHLASNRVRCVMPSITTDFRDAA